LKSFCLTKVDDLIGLSRILATIPALVSHKFEGALYPVELANGIASMSSYPSANRQYREWRMFGGGPENIHYSTLDQITRDNVHRLEVAWRFDVRLRQIGLNPCTGRYENSSQFAAALRSSPFMA
jgi:glucose dehydrogenase